MLDAINKFVNKTMVTIHKTLPYKESLQSLIENPLENLQSITIYHHKHNIENISHINSMILSQPLFITHDSSGLKIYNSRHFDSLQDMIDWIAFCVFVGAISIIDLDISKKEFISLLPKRLQKFI